MHLCIRSDGFCLTSGLHDVVQLRLNDALHRFHGMVDMRALRDENGPRGRLDKRCQYEVRLRVAPAVVIDARGADLYAAIGCDAQRIERQVARTVSRRRRW